MIDLLNFSVSSSGFETSNQPTSWLRIARTTAFCHARFCRDAETFAAENPKKAMKNCPAPRSMIIRAMNSTVSIGTVPPEDSAAETSVKKGLRKKRKETIVTPKPQSEMAAYPRQLIQAIGECEEAAEAMRLKLRGRLLVVPRRAALDGVRLDRCHVRHVCWRPEVLRRATDASAGLQARWRSYFGLAISSSRVSLNVTAADNLGSPVACTIEGEGFLDLVRLFVVLQTWRARVAARKRATDVTIDPNCVASDGALASSASCVSPRHAFIRAALSLNPIEKFANNVLAPKFFSWFASSEAVAAMHQEHIDSPPVRAHDQGQPARGRSGRGD